MSKLQRATMFYSDLTQVDMAVMDGEGCLKGLSFKVQVLIEGPMDEEESVVIDFSTFKKDMKAMIDGPNGLDHKILLSQNVCDNLVIQNWLQKDPTQDLVFFDTDAISGALPESAVIIHNVDPKRLTKDPAQVLLAVVSDHIAQQFGLYFKQNKIDALATVSAIPSGYHALSELTIPFTDNPNTMVSYFGYVHGLKDSTSYGCQNIAHGHRSYIAIEPKEFVDLQSLDILCVEIADHIDGAVLINHENILLAGDDITTIGYSTGRGPFELELNNELQKQIIMPHETTCEYIAHYINETFGERLEALGAKTVFLSEGVNKGSFLKY